MERDVKGMGQDTKTTSVTTDPPGRKSNPSSNPTNILTT